MGKNHRHAKKLKSEKSKVHIKTKTKFLPKGQNVTNTAFKIRPIVLQEQLKERQAEGLLGKKKANIDELISKLKHYNEAVKVEACVDLKEAIVSHPLDATQIYLSLISQNASALIQDRERKVRRSAIKLLHAIVEKVSTATIRPFFNYFLTNLKCAMTNINKHIQEDSLLLLDALLEHQNLLIAENFDTIFPTFLTLISKSKNNLGTERSLSLNLEGKVSSVKWRIKVLTRLYGILSALTQTKTIKNLDKNEEIFIEAKGNPFIPLYKKIDNQVRVGGRTDAVSQEFDTQIANLTQLLHEIWIEVVPEKTKKSGGEPLLLASEESVAVFSCIVNILHLLYEYLQLSGNVELFSNNKSVIFLDHLLCNFPYIHNRKNNFEIIKDFSRSFVLNYDQNCTEENLIVIYVFLTLRINLNARNKPKTSHISTYLNNCLKSPRNFSPKSYTYLVKILKELFMKPVNMCQRLGIAEAEIMENVVAFYTNRKIPDFHKSDLLEVLTCPRFEKYQLWTEKLPDFLCANQVSVKLIDAVLKLCTKGQSSVQDGVTKSVKQILGNLRTMEITEATNVENARKKFVCIFFYLPNLSDEDLGEISDFVKSNPDCAYSKYFENVLELSGRVV
ncbi:Testis-expressed sequence 10 protein homolog-like Protein [Tribolium castaneum]|uniref:Testis-expressed sequence 10 protein homolog-like Protein n=1 Tax=Tribolium castaneum TaxID=7070 RepID=D2A610_TRICA|nr:PREDICTED: testis-expressed sequence 10 protein [Tribolium castaneum]EFA04998.2 Testis-expressed sequence 10 protein homolog-like Protein [Tribolium castaneum]|eukprot:XP_008194797.1 PREDICTED: testis-expressed sequence 10 protein [Tribolium castaneum]